MKTATGRLLLAAGLLLFPVVAAPTPSSPAPMAAQSGPRLEIEPGEWDFGNTGPGETLLHDFVLKNTGNRDLVLGRIASACACAAAVVGTEVLPPDGETVLRVTLETRDYRGVLERWLTITSNDRRGAARVKVRAYVEEPGRSGETARREGDRRGPPPAGGQGAEALPKECE